MENSSRISTSVAGPGLLGSSSIFSGLFIAKEFNGIEEKGPGDNKGVDVQKLLVAFLNMYLGSSCFNDESFFLVKITKAYFPQVALIR